MTSHSTNCPVCGSNEIILFSFAKDYEYFTTQKLYEYSNCTKCESIFLQAPPIDMLSIIYPDNYYSVASLPEQKKSLAGLLDSFKMFLDKRLFKKVLSNIPGDSLSCLDVGGGAGTMMNVVRLSDPRVQKTTVLDLNENQKLMAEQNQHLFIHQRVEELDEESKFDFVLMLNLIEHVEKPHEVLRKVHEILTEHGRCLIKTPNTLSINRWLFQKHYWGGVHAPRHWVLFNKNSFTNLANESGFEVENFKYTQGASQWVASILGSFEKYFPAKEKKIIYQMRIAAFLTLFFAIVDFFLLPFKKTDQMIFVLKRYPLPEQVDEKSSENRYPPNRRT